MITDYKTALKATTLFGGVQIFRIIINMLRLKLIAIILGPSGFGLIGLYNTLITFIQSITSFGLSSSAVRDISAADINHKPKIVTALYHWFFGTGILGAIVMILFSPIISKWTFENYNYIFSIIILSTAVLFQTVNSGELAILQGYRDMKSIAKVHVLGSIIGLLISLPIFLIWKDKGIVPSIILSSFLLFIISNSYVRRLRIKYVKSKIQESFLMGKQSLKLGLMLSLSAVLVSFVDLLLKSFLTKQSGTEIVGLYQAGWTITTSYIGLVLTAMSTDFFPRLSNVINDKLQTKIIVTQQLEIAITILGPLVTIMITFLPFFVNLLYTKDFTSIIPMTMIMLLGAIFKTVSWGISYIFLAKGDGKHFFFNELLINIVVLFTSIFLFYFWGLVGIGIAYSLNYFIYFVLVYFRAKNIYNFAFVKGFWFFLAKYFFICFLTFISLFLIGYNIIGYLVGIFLSTIMIIMSVNEINKVFNFLPLLRKYSINK